MIEILIDKKENEKEIALVENGNLIEYYIDENESTRREGNLYVGIVKDIIKGMQAAFVDIGTEKNSFIHLKDVLPKIDETKQKMDSNLTKSFGKIRAVDSLSLDIEKGKITGLIGADGSGN